MQVSLYAFEHIIHALELAMSQAPGDKPFHRAIDRLPTGPEHPGRLPPAQPSRPARQESHHRAAHRAPAVAPREVLDDQAMLRALDSSRRIDKPSGHPPVARTASVAPADSRSPVPAADTPSSARGCHGVARCGSRSIPPPARRGASPPLSYTKPEKSCTRFKMVLT
jgi:hypothetical protein